MGLGTLFAMALQEYDTIITCPFQQFLCDVYCEYAWCLVHSILTNLVYRQRPSQKLSCSEVSTPVTNTVAEPFVLDDPGEWTSTKVKVRRRHPSSPVWATVLPTAKWTLLHQSPNAAAQPVLLNDPEEWMLAKRHDYQTSPTFHRANSGRDIERQQSPVVKSLSMWTRNMGHAQASRISVAVSMHWTFNLSACSGNALLSDPTLSHSDPLPLTIVMNIHPLQHQPMWHWAERLLVSSTYFQLPPQPHSIQDDQNLDRLHWKLGARAEAEAEAEAKKAEHAKKVLRAEAPKEITSSAVTQLMPHYPRVPFACSSTSSTC